MDPFFTERVKLERAKYRLQFLSEPFHFFARVNGALHQRVAEHSSQNSSIGKHMLNTGHGTSKQKLINNFSVLTKCRSKTHKREIIQDLKPTLNVQSDFNRAKLVT